MGAFLLVVSFGNGRWSSKSTVRAFCRYYTQNEKLFGNATHSYAEAYDYKLDTLSTHAVYEPAN
jgi:hypothetical protein